MYYQTLCKKGHAHLAENYKNWSQIYFWILGGHGLRSVSTSGVATLRTLLVSAGQNFRPWCSRGREKVVGDDNDLSNLRESCGDVLKLQRCAEFAGNCWICVNWCDRNFLEGLSNAVSTNDAMMVLIPLTLLEWVLYIIYSIWYKICRKLCKCLENVNM